MSEEQAPAPIGRDDGPTWRRLLAEATERLGDTTEARRIVEEASGREGAELTLRLDEHATALPHARYRTMLERRACGEPLQYVLGRWGFRTLDLHVDRRVLIPRPETELVVEHALAIIDELDARLVVDLGTGSGAIALSLVAERTGLTVWATDSSADALAVATANLAGIGRAGTRVRIVQGDWLDALPDELRGTIDVIVSNPPYVAEGEELPSDVADWEPRAALVAGSTGLEAVRRIVTGAPDWLAGRGAVVIEIGETQADAAAELARARGFTAVEVRPDLAGRPRVLMARRGTS